MKWTTEKPSVEGFYVIYIPEWHFLDDGRWSCKYLCIPGPDYMPMYPEDPTEGLPYWDTDGECLRDDLQGTMYLGPLPNPIT